jgi:hypothetical protein
MPERLKSLADDRGTSPKMLQLLRKRLRQLARVAFVVAMVSVVAATAIAIWWLTSLNRLPDIGDPFDLAEFRAFNVPDDQNAFTYFRRASEKVTLLRGAVGAVGADPRDLKFSWSIADPMWREWALENGEALGLFQRGAEQPDAANPGGNPTADVFSHLLITLAILDASRRQESGDTAGAWNDYRLVLRAITHFRRRGSTLQRVCARGASRQLHRRLCEWAAEPRTTIAQLHTALNFVLENEPDPAWDSFAIKYGYLELMDAIDRPIPTVSDHEVEGEWALRLGDMPLSPEAVGRLEAMRRFLFREPERSRRVLRLLCANYLAHVQRRKGRPRRPAVWAMFSYVDSSVPITKRRIGVPLYPVGPEAPSGARALPPQELAGWLVATLDVKRRLIRGYDEWLPPVRARDLRTVADRKAHHDLVIMLATETYRRERASVPRSQEDLVGTYLKSLPDDGFSDPADETPVTVE